MKKEEERRNRYRGRLAGLAVGDALGTTLEFKAPGAFYGHEAIPREWKATIAHREVIESSADRLYRFDSGPRHPILSGFHP